VAVDKDGGITPALEIYSARDVLEAPPRPISDDEGRSASPSRSG